MAVQTNANRRTGGRLPAPAGGALSVVLTLTDAAAAQSVPETSGRTSWWMFEPASTHAPSIIGLFQVILYLTLAVCAGVFAVPFVLPREPYMWLGAAAMYEHHWLIFAFTGVPGLLFLLVARPRDRFGVRAGDNPCRANSLEWATTSPPVHTNFDTIPTVYRGPYEYSSPIVYEDYLPQNVAVPDSLARG